MVSLQAAEAEKPWSAEKRDKKTTSCMAQIGEIKDEIGEDDWPAFARCAVEAESERAVWNCSPVLAKKAVEAEKKVERLKREMEQKERELKQAKQQRDEQNLVKSDEPAPKRRDHINLLGDENPLN